MTIHLHAKKIWPGLNLTELNIILWACTTYPIGEPEEVIAALKDAYEKSGGDLWLALEEADKKKSTKT